jgi:hypothetical protein
MLMTTRRARQLLTREGVSAWSAAHVLDAGLAGRAIRSGSVVLYEEECVTELAERPSISWPEVERLCPAGFFVSRRNFPATSPRPEQLAALSNGWDAVSPWQWIAVHVQLEAYGSFPFVATIGGLVVLGADVVEARGLLGLELRDPGPWFDGLEGRWFPTGQGRPWVLHVGPLALGRTET